MIPQESLSTSGSSFAIQDVVNTLSVALVNEFLEVEGMS